MVEDEPRELDVRSLRAIAHPLRFRMLALLNAEGPSTATRLAERLGENTGATSYHLRQLAEHDFIEEDVERGDGRDRWWRAKHPSMRLRATELERGATGTISGAVDIYMEEVLRHQFRGLREFLANRHRWPDEWREATAVNGYPLDLTPGRLRELVAEIERTITRYRQESSDPQDTERVVLLLNAFPQRRLPTEESIGPQQ